EQFDSLVGDRRQRLLNLRRSCLAALQPGACPGRLQRAPSSKERKRILLAEPEGNFGVAPGSSSITANHLEVGLEAIGEDQSRYMTGFDRDRNGFFDERPRWSGLAKLPLSVGEVSSCDRTGIRAEAEHGLTVPLGIVNAQRLN